MSHTHNQTNSSTVWVVTEGIAGTENQCLAVATALGFQPIVKRVGLKQPWKLLSPYLGLENAYTFTGDTLTAPWPDVVLAGGRKAIAAARYIRRQSKGHSRIIFFQNPRVNLNEFDVVVAPAHDHITGNNVIISKATPTKFNASMIAEIQNKNPSPFPRMGDENITLIVGGGVAGRAMPDTEQKIVLNTVELLLAHTTKNIRVIGSRRTPAPLVQKIRDLTNNKPHIITWFPDDAAPNPYADAMAHAHVVLVTADSPSMISDAASAGRPTYVVGNAQTTRHGDLIRFLEAEGHVRTFDNDLSVYPHKLLDDVGHIASEIRRKINI